MADAPTDAIYVASKAFNAGASERALFALIDVWKFTLTWISHNELAFAIVMLFLAFWVYQRRVGRADIEHMRIEYDRTRDANKTPQLPLPPPDKNRS